MPQRSRAREVALQVLFQDDLIPRTNPADFDALIQRRLDADDLIEFARLLVAGVRQHREELDRRITELAVNWSLDRMAPTDRNVMRIGAYELSHTDTPHAVILNEAIELAKRFGTAESGSFVNGILDQLAHATQKQE